MAKGKKVGTGGKVAKFIVAISFGKGVVICERYETMNGNFLASFIDENFNTMFSYSDKGLSRMWLQDGDPSQNSRAAQDAMVGCQSELLKILPRSPDLNPIENIFHIVSRKRSPMNCVKSSVIEYKKQEIAFRWSQSIKLHVYAL